MWGAGADPMMHAINCGYIVGTTLAPVITGSFLSPDTDTYNVTDLSNTTTTATAYGTTAEAGGSSFGDDSQIEIPYGIAGFASLLVCVGFVTLFAIGPPKALVCHTPKKTSLREVFSPGSCAGGRSGLGAALVFLLVLYYVLILAEQLGANSLNFTFAVESDLNFDKQDAIMMDLSQKICGVIASLLVIPLSRWITAPVIMFYSVVGSAVAMTLIATVGVRDRTSYWIFTCVHQFVVSTAWGAGYAFIDKYITLYAFVVALTSIGAGTSGFVFLIVYGHVYENTTPESIYYVSAGVAWTWVLLVIVMQVVAGRLGNRHAKKDAVEVKVDTPMGEASCELEHSNIDL